MPTLVLKFGEMIKNRFSFDKNIVSMGRATDNDIVIENLAVSRKHAQIEKVGEKYVLIDLNSANGTFVNGERVLRRPLAHFDSISIGKHQVIFLDEAKVQPAEAVSMSPFDLDRTVIVNPGQSRPPIMDIVPPHEESTPKAPEMPTQRVQPMPVNGEYVASNFSGIYHKTSCEWVQGIKAENKVFFKDRAEADRSGKRNCRICMPVIKNREANNPVRSEESESSRELEMAGT